jgi:hypothetical protein
MSKTPSDTYDSVQYIISILTYMIVYYTEYIVYQIYFNTPTITAEAPDGETGE